MNNANDEIKKIRWVYEQYTRKLEQVKGFVDTTNSQKKFIEYAEVNLQPYTPFISEYTEQLKKISNSVVLYNAVIISVYGSFELYVDEILKAYIEYLKSRSMLFENLPPKLQVKQLDKSAEFLSKPKLFQNYGLTNEQVISSLEATIIRNQVVDVNEKLLISHGGNLKTKQLGELLGEFGFEDASAKLKKNISLRQFSQGMGFDEDVILSNGFPLLDTIVEERNKVAHGWRIDDRISFDLLLDKYIPFFNFLCKAINDLLISQIIQNEIDENRVLAFDDIIKTWNNGKIIGINSKQFSLHVGDVLYYTTPDDWNYPFEIIGLKNDSKSRKYIRTKNKDITIETDIKIKENYRIWCSNVLV